MTLQQGFFYFFSTATLLTALQVILSRHPVRAVLCLIFTFFSVAGLWVLLEAEFLAASLVLVYVGAVMVLFLFVVMMINSDQVHTREGFTRYLPVGVCVAVLLVLALVYAFRSKALGFSVSFALPPPLPAGASHVKTLGTLLYTQYLYPLELAAIVLLIAMIAAIGLTARHTRRRRTMDPSLQVRVRKEDRLRLIKDLS